MNSQHEFVLRTVEERDIRFIRLWFTDILGALKSVVMSPSELESVSYTHLTLPTNREV